jgi:hypothetical protein
MNRAAAPKRISPSKLNKLADNLVKLSAHYYDVSSQLARHPERHKSSAG